MKINVSLTTQEPYTSPPIAGGSYIVVKDGGSIKPKSSGLKGSPISRTYVEPCYLSTTTEIAYFPVIRSLQLCKVIRDITVTRVFDSLKDRDLSISKVSTYAGMQVGAASGKLTGMNPSLDQLTTALHEPIAIFGGGSYGLKSTLSVSNAHVLHPSLIENNLISVPGHLSELDVVDLESYQLTYVVPIHRRDPVFNIQNSQELTNISAVQDYETQVAEWQAEVQKQQQSRKEDSAEKKGDLNNLVAVEAVPRGVTFIAELELPDAAGDAVKGAVINAVMEMKEQGVRIGGRVSRGMGKFVVDYSFENHDEDENVERYLDAYSAWLDSVTPTQLAEFYEK